MLTRAQVELQELRLDDNRLGPVRPLCSYV